MKWLLEYLPDPEDFVDLFPWVLAGIAMGYSIKAFTQNAAKALSAHYGL